MSNQQGNNDSQMNEIYKSYDGKYRAVLDVELIRIQSGENKVNER